MPLYFIPSSKFEPLMRHLSNEQKEQFLARISQRTRGTLKLVDPSDSQHGGHIERYTINGIAAKLRTAKALMLAYLKCKITQ